MTFLYDEKILTTLGNCVANVLAKKAQQTPPSNELVKKLVYNLDSQINVDEIKQKVVSDPGANLTYDQLENLDTLLLFLHKNRVNYLNHDIVSAKDDGTGDRTPISIANNTLYVHKKSLAGYLEHLGNVAKETENKVLGSLVNNVIRESSKILGKGTVSTVDVRYKDEFHEGSELMDVPLAHVSPKGSGTKQLTVGDLKSKTAFNNWIQDSVEDINAAYKNLGYFMGYLLDQFKTLYRRARTKFSEDLYKTALNRLMSLGTAFNISFDSTDDIPTSQQPSSDNVNRSRLLTNVIDNLPLRNEDISMARINAFYNQLIKVDRKYNTFKNETLKHLNKASAMTSMGLTTFPLTSDFVQVQDSLKNPTVNNFYIYTEHLRKALGIIFNALSNFRTTFSKEIQNLKGANGQILLQVGRSTADLSVYKNNINALNDMRRKLSSSVKTKNK